MAGLAFLLCALAPTLARAVSLSDLDSVETVTIWSAILALHLVLAAAFCCCERPMTDPIRMASAAGGGGATARTKRESTPYDGQPMKTTTRTMRSSERR